MTWIRSHSFHIPATRHLGQLLRLIRPAAADHVPDSRTALPSTGETHALVAGDPEYRAYVGPPGQYDFMGATQFRLLCTLGLRDHHDLLDVGCGSLRAGRLLIPYLAPGRYCGIEPNRWLIDDAIARQLGTDILRIKQPRFDDNDRFDTTVFERRFDFILSQSIFSHTGPDLLRQALVNIRHALQPQGILAATFVEGTADESQAGWFYPQCVRYTPARIRLFAAEAQLHVVRIPWFHPRQAWYLFATDRARLPTKANMKLLRGAVLFDPEFTASHS